MTKIALYRHRDAAGNLLYVGISLNPFARARQHRQRSDWFHTVAQIDIEWFDTQAKALQAEWQAIKNEHPTHNRAYTRIPPRSTEINVMGANGRELKGRDYQRMRRNTLADMHRINP